MFGLGYDLTLGNFQLAYWKFFDTTNFFEPKNTFPRQLNHH